MITERYMARGMLGRDFDNIPNFCLLLCPMIVPCMHKRERWPSVFAVSTIKVTIRAGLFILVCLHTAMRVYIWLFRRGSECSDQLSLIIVREYL